MTGPITGWATEPTARGIEMVAQASRASYWLDRPLRPKPRPRLVGPVSADLLVVGGGFTGLWAAVQAAEEHPGRRVVLVERDRIAEQASGRNGGFCSASITHGLANGVDRFADEMPELLAMGRDTLDEIEAAVRAEPETTAWDITRSVTWSRPFSDLSVMLSRMALHETHAHLVVLAERGILTAHDGVPERWTVRTDPTG